MRLMLGALGALWQTLFESGALGSLFMNDDEKLPASPPNTEKSGIGISNSWFHKRDEEGDDDETHSSSLSRSCS